MSSTRDALVTSAAALIFEQGFAATGISRILAEAEAGSSSFYHFFSSKEDLLLAILDHYQERFEREIVGPTRREPDPLARVFSILGFYRTFLSATGCRLGCPIGNLAGEVSDSHPRVREKLDETFELWRRAVAENLAALEPPLGAPDPEALACFVLTVMEGGVMQARVARSLEPFEQSVACLRDYLARIFPHTPSPGEDGPTRTEEENPR